MGTVWRANAWLLLVALAVAGCGGSSGGTGDDDDGDETDASTGSNGDGDGDGDGDGGDNGGDSDTNGVPPGECEPGTRMCSEDGFGQHNCGWDEATGSNAWGWRIPCGDTETCANGTCSANACRTPELLFLIDRSDSMLEGGRWDWVVHSVESFSLAHGTVVQQGVRMFPDDQCDAGQIEPIALRPEGVGLFLDPPSTGAATPIAAALTQVSPAFGDPDQGQAVVLITDGDETCGDAGDPRRRASELFRVGVETYPVAVSTQANLTLLTEIAQAGGTAQAHQVSGSPSLDLALAEIVEALEPCTCATGTANCTDGVLHACDSGGNPTSTVCPTGACADATSCVEDSGCAQLCASAVAPWPIPSFVCVDDAFQAGGFAWNVGMCLPIETLDPADIAECDQCLAGAGVPSSLCQDAVDACT